jgi:hypothetical protein
VETVLNGRLAAKSAIEESIVVPASIYEWKTSEAGSERALAVLLENRAKFQVAFSRGLTVVGFTRDAEGNGIYELGSLAQSKSIHAS